MLTGQDRRGAAWDELMAIAKSSRFIFSQFSESVKLIQKSTGPNRRDQHTVSDKLEYYAEQFVIVIADYDYDYDAHSGRQTTE